MKKLIIISFIAFTFCGTILFAQTTLYGGGGLHKGNHQLDFSTANLAT